MKRNCLESVEAGRTGPAADVGEIACGALVGLCASMAMTVVMRRLHAALPRSERYPLPPRELADALMPQGPPKARATLTTLGHFGYGALAGAIHACLLRGRLSPIAYGLSVWAVSYLGWIPAAGLLTPAYKHPPRRNALMLAAHAVWGAALGLCQKELRLVSARAFGPRRNSEAALTDRRHLIEASTPSPPRAFLPPAPPVARDTTGHSFPDRRHKKRRGGS